MRERHVHQLIVRHKVMFVVQSATEPPTFNFQWKTELCFFLSDFNSDNVYYVSINQQYHYMTLKPNLTSSVCFNLQYR